MAEAQDLWTPMVRARAKAEGVLADAGPGLDYFSALLHVGDLFGRLNALVLIGIHEFHEELDSTPASYDLSRNGGNLGAWRSAIEETIPSAMRSGEAGGIKPFIDALCASLSDRRLDQSGIDTVGGLFELRNQLIQHDSQALRRFRILDVITWLGEIRNKTHAHGSFGQEFFADQSRVLKEVIDYVVDESPLWDADLVLGVESRSKEKLCRLLRGGSPSEEQGFRSIDVGQVGCSFRGEEWILPQLVWIDPASDQTYIANGSWGQKLGPEMMCCAIAARAPGESAIRRPIPVYRVEPVTVPLPASETEGDDELREEDSGVLTNLPRAESTYVTRPSLEDELLGTLREPRKRHLVNISGMGGIGKTSLVLNCTHRLVSSGDCSYAQVVWVSARDVDLTLHGPKSVRQGTEDLEGLRNQFTELCGVASGQPAKEFFEEELSRADSGTLLILDNFETFGEQDEAYEYLDRVVQPPSKVVITSRHEFSGNYRIPITGMDREQAFRLIKSAARDHDREPLATEEACQRIFDECQGHPYAMKLVSADIGDASALKGLIKHKLGEADVMEALFSQSVEQLTESGDFLFLFIGRFPKGISELALRLIGEEQDLDWSGGMDALVSRSLVEKDSVSRIIKMPSMAQEFAGKRLDVSPRREVVMECADFVKQIPALVRGDGRTAGLALSQMIETNSPILKGRNGSDLLLSLAGTEPSAWRLVAEELARTGANPAKVDRAYEKAVEHDPGNADLYDAWINATPSNDKKLQLQVQVAASGGPTVSVKRLSSLARYLSELRHQDSNAHLSRATWNSHMRPIAMRLEERKDELDATDLSRLAWLYLAMSDESSAKLAVRRGIELDPSNHHICSLAEKLEIKIQLEPL